jgi:hypothetical protein
MECKFCGYKNGFFWEDSEYFEITGKHGDFWTLGKLKRENQVYENEAQFAFMCPVPECQRTQIED